MGRPRSLFPIQLLLLSTQLISTLSSSGSSREALEIVIGFGGGIVISDSPPPPEPLPPPPPPPPPSAFENILQHRAYLVIQRFKLSITSDPGNKTATWTGSRICNNDGRGYEGFYCGTLPNLKNNLSAIASVDLNGFGLSAPSVVGLVDKLPELAVFHANSNNFGGNLPDFTKLPFLYELDLSNNLLEGAFPSDVLHLVNLSFLDLRYNAFAGAVPPGVFNIRTELFFLNNNKFNENLPANIGSTTAAYLTLAFNGFTGPIPSSIGKAGDTLIEVLFLGNRLSGCLPYEVGLLKKATVFDAGSNQITGPIPMSFGCLQKMEQLNLAGNQLYGEVPHVVCRLAKFGHLANFSLSDNYFTSVAPSCQSLIQLNVLDVRKNCIPGFPKQRSPEECARFLKLPKIICPNMQNFPCNLPLVVPAVDRRPASGYITYETLHLHDKP